MKYLPLTAAGVLLLAGSMSVYAQTETQRPLQPDSSMSQGQQGGQSSGEEKRSQEQGGTERRSGGDRAQTGGDRDGSAVRRDEQQGGRDANRNAQDRDDSKGAQRGNNDRTGNQAEQRSGSDEKRNRAESEQRSGGSQDNNQRAKQSGGEGGKSKAKPREASSKIQPQQKTVIKQRIVERNVRPAQVNFSVNVGSVVPRTVVLYDLPAEIIEIAPAYRAYKYVLADDDTIVVIDPDTWEIVDVIDI
jgi:hypothetical protein